MDIYFKNDDNVFNYRVAAVIRNDEKILCQKGKTINYYTLIGGRCSFNESSVEAVIREVKEETGYKTSYIKTLGIIENFFTSNYNGKKYHEILIIHELEFLNDIDLSNIVNIEGKEELSYSWIDITKLKEEKFQPSILIKHINDNNLFHIINKD